MNAQAQTGTAQTTRFKDKVVVITGAASGVGEVRRFVREGAPLALADRDAAKLEAGLDRQVRGAHPDGPWRRT